MEHTAIDQLPESAAPALVMPEPAATHDLVLARPPEVVLEEAQRAARALTKVLEAKPRPIVFNGKRYLEVDDWILLGRFYGVVVSVATTTPLVMDGARGWEAHAEAVRVTDGMVLSRAVAMCLDSEPNWQRKPSFQLRSMAQTRACARVLSQVLRWVVTLAGYAGTPAEEMPRAEPPQGERHRGGHRGRSRATTTTTDPAAHRERILDRVHALEAELGADAADAIALEHGIGARGDATTETLITYGKALRARLTAVAESA